MIFNGVLNYLRWVFPVTLAENEGVVTFDGKEYDHERDLITTLYSKFSYLPEKYFGDRRFYRVWDVVHSTADDCDFCNQLYRLCADIGYERGFLDRFDRVIIADEAVAARFYWLSGFGSSLEMGRAFFEHTPEQFKAMFWGGGMKSLIEKFHEKKRDDFIQRFEKQNPLVAEYLRECKTEKEVELFLKKDGKFLDEFRERLNKAGKMKLVDGLFAIDLGL